MTAVVVFIVDVAITLGLWTLLISVVISATYMGMYCAEGAVNMYDASKAKRAYRKAEKKHEQAQAAQQNAETETQTV